jgi:hypothetical protein
MSSQTAPAARRGSIGSWAKICACDVRPLSRNSRLVYVFQQGWL